MIWLIILNQRWTWKVDVVTFDDRSKVTGSQGNRPRQLCALIDPFTARIATLDVGIQSYVGWHPHSNHSLRNSSRGSIRTKFFLGLNLWALVALEPPSNVTPDTSVFQTFGWGFFKAPILSCFTWLHYFLVEWMNEALPSSAFFVFLSFSHLLHTQLFDSIDIEVSFDAIDTYSVIPCNLQLPGT